MPTPATGQIWRCKHTNRLVRILEDFVHDTGPAWTYCNENGTAECDGPSHPNWYWHYCDVLSFEVMNNYEFVSDKFCL